MIKLNKVELAQGDAVKMGSLTLTNNFVCTSLMINRWLTLCQDTCEITFTSDEEKTTQGFELDVKFQESQHGRCNSHIGQQCKRQREQWKDYQQYLKGLNRNVNERLL